METWTDIENEVDNYFTECQRLRKEREQYVIELEEVE
jgi:hypothetical protein